MTDLEEFIKITRNILDRINQDADCGFTKYKDISEMKRSILGDLNKLENGNLNHLLPIYRHFLPTSTFQDITIDENWPQDYMDISGRMDELYQRLKPQEKEKSILESIKEKVNSIRVRK